MSIRRFALATLASALIGGHALAADTRLNVSYSPTAARASRPAPSSMACVPTW